MGVQVQEQDEQADYSSLCRVRLIKVDVEGLEMEVLDGGLRLLRACRPLLYLEYNGHGPRVDTQDQGEGQDQAAGADTDVDNSDGNRQEFPPEVSSMTLIAFLRERLGYR